MAVAVQHSFFILVPLPVIMQGQPLNAGNVPRDCDSGAPSRDRCMWCPVVVDYGSADQVRPTRGPTTLAQPFFCPHSSEKSERGNAALRHGFGQPCRSTFSTPSKTRHQRSSTRRLPNRRSYAPLSPSRPLTPGHGRPSSARGGVRSGCTGCKRSRLATRHAGLCVCSRRIM